MAALYRAQVSGLKRTVIESVDAEKERLKHLFEQENCKVTEVSVMVDKKSGKSRGFAFVDFTDLRSLLAAEVLDTTSQPFRNLTDNTHGPFQVKRQKVTLKVKENTDKSISVPEGRFIFAAFYGDAERSNGRVVTDIVKKLHAEGKDIRASSDLFGDPVAGTEKTLFVDVKCEWELTHPDPGDVHSLNVRGTFFHEDNEDTDTGKKPPPPPKSFPLPNPELKARRSILPSWIQWMSCGGNNQ